MRNTANDFTPAKVEKKTQDESGKKNDRHEIVLARQVRNVELFKLALLGPGQMFGDDDIFFDRPYNSTIICRSTVGVVIQMNGPELLKKMRGNEECWKIFQSYIQNKEMLKRQRLNKLDHVFHKEPISQGGTLASTTSAENSSNTVKKIQFPNLNQSVRNNTTINNTVLINQTILSGGDQHSSRERTQSPIDNS